MHFEKQNAFQNTFPEKKKLKQKCESTGPTLPKIFRLVTRNTSIFYLALGQNKPLPKKMMVEYTISIKKSVNSYHHSRPAPPSADLSSTWGITLVPLSCVDSSSFSVAACPKPGRTF